MRDSKSPLRTRFRLIVAAPLIAAPAGFALAESAYPQTSSDLLTNPGFEPPVIQACCDAATGNPFDAFVASGWSPLDAFALHQVEATAQASSVTVFVWSAPTYPLRHLTLFADNASLSRSGIISRGGSHAAGFAGMGARSAAKSDLLYAIALQFGFTLHQLLALNQLTKDAVLQVGQTLIVSVVTPTPTEPPTATPTPSASRLCLLASDDRNGNGTRDSGEALLAGVQFEVKDLAGSSVGRYSSTGADEPHCLKDLPTGRYAVAVLPPGGRHATTETPFSVGLLAGDTFNLDFGSQLAPTAAVAASATATCTPQATAPAELARSDNALLALLGIALIVAAIAASFFGLRAGRT